MLLHLCPPSPASSHLLHTSVRKNRGQGQQVPGLLLAHTCWRPKSTQTCGVCAAALGSAAVLDLPSPLPLLPAFNAIYTNCVILNPLSEAQLSHYFPGSGKRVGKHTQHTDCFSLPISLANLATKVGSKIAACTRTAFRLRQKPVTPGC